MSTVPEVSVVCSTFNRAGRLRSLLTALDKQTFNHDRFEVVIVDNGSGDDTSTVLDQLQDELGLQLRRIALATNRGASGGRNAGWRAATAPIVAFTDDDCVAHPEWLASGMVAMADPALAVVVGRTRPNPAQAANSGPFSRTQSVDAVSGTRYLNTCNIFYRRADLEAVNGFDERFENKGGEDTDLGWRVLDRGGSVAFVEDALVLHDVFPGSFRSAFKEAVTWSDIPLVAARHPKRARPLLVHRIFWKKSHKHVLVAIGAMTASAVARNAIPLVGIAPWLWFRVKKAPLARGKVTRFKYLPHAFAIDAAEMATMVRGSIKNRTFVL